MRQTILYTLAAVVLTVAFVSCSGDRFSVEGKITGAADSVLYFENLGLEGPVLLDSVRLDADGAFRFSGSCPEAPEFYRLRIGGQIINVSIDSTETVGISAQWPAMATQYEVTGSDNCQRIKELSLMQIDLTRRALALERDTRFTRDEIRDSLSRMIDAYKEQVKRQYIYKDTRATSSYFALFQTIGDYLIFNPHTSHDDIRVFAAVATSWDTYHPGALRGQNLHNIAIEGMKNERIVRQKTAARMDESKIVTAGLIDIQLNDNHGRRRTLTELAGKVVLLDFHMFGMEQSPQRILMLRELYNKYHDRGFEIYQVSLDADEHFWKQQTAALPWVSVHDGDGLESRRLAAYNVGALPEFFLIDRSNTLVGRSSQLGDLDAAVRKLL